MLETPWGPAQSTARLAPSVVWVSTSSHGGLLIANDQAGRLLTPTARSKGARYRDQLAYEEDCLYAIAFYEHPEWCQELQRQDGKTPESVDAIRDAAWHTISAWDADYLLARGIAPEPARFARWQERREDQRRRASRDPDLIVSGSSGSSWQPVPAGAVLVSTADGASHLVTAASYANRHPAMPLLSQCQPYSEVPA